MLMTRKNNFAMRELNDNIDQKRRTPIKSLKLPVKD